MKRGILRILTGETAVGKTEAALAWAEANNAEIISCDSTLFYRGMDIGTAKPTTAERARVPHHLIDICEVDQPIDIKAFVEKAREAVEAIFSRGRRVLVTGGSGFYLKSFFAPVADDVAVPEVLRKSIAEELEREGLSALVERLSALNPQGLGALDTANPRRVTRALERCVASGKSLAELSADFAKRPGAFVDFELCCVRIVRPPDDLAACIVRRVGQMLEAGLVDEVRRLRALGLERNPSAARAIGYRETLAMLDGHLPAEALAAEIVKNTKRLARKQRTWFRTQLPVHREISAGQAPFAE